MFLRLFLVCFPRARYNIEARDLRQALEALPGITAVSVSRTVSRTLLTVTGTVLSNSNTVLRTSATLVGTLTRGSPVWIGSLPFTVCTAGTFDGTQVPLCLYGSPGVISQVRVGLCAFVYAHSMRSAVVGCISGRLATISSRVLATC